MIYKSNPDANNTINLLRLDKLNGVICVQIESVNCEITCSKVTGQIFLFFSFFKNVLINILSLT